MKNCNEINDFLLFTSICLSLSLALFLFMPTLITCSTGFSLEFMFANEVAHRNKMLVMPRFYFTEKINNYELAN